MTNEDAKTIANNLVLQWMIDRWGGKSTDFLPLTDKRWLDINRRLNHIFDEIIASKTPDWISRENIQVIESKLTEELLKTHLLYIKKFWTASISQKFGI